MTSFFLHGWKNEQFPVTLRLVHRNTLTGIPYEYITLEIPQVLLAAPDRPAGLCAAGRHKHPKFLKVAVLFCSKDRKFATLTACLITSSGALPSRCVSMKTGERKWQHADNMTTCCSYSQHLSWGIKTWLVPGWQDQKDISKYELSMEQYYRGHNS